jgi:hypothetical protein
MWIWLITKIPFLLQIAPAFKFLGGKMSLIVGAVAAGLTLWIWWQGHRIDNLKGDLSVAKSDLRVCQDANESNQGAIGKLQDANKALSGALTASDERVREIAENLSRREADTANRLSGALRELEDLKHENPSCEELAAVDIGAVCPAVVDRLREHASGR